MNKNISDIIYQNKYFIIVSVIGLLVGIVISTIIYKANEPQVLEGQGTIIRSQSQWKRKTYAKKYNQAVEKHLVELKDQKEAEPIKKAKVSAYSCGGLKTEAEIKMNCPSLLRGGPKTATGTTPRPGVTVACDRANLGREFEIDGVGKVKCEDTGGAIKGSNRFDLYVGTVAEARQFGVQNISYKLVGGKI